MLSSYSQTYTLAAVHANAQSRMSLTRFVDDCILIATLHANSLGIGYADLIKHGWGWVLSRLYLKILRYPGINETYTVSTWIEDMNRLYSDRVFLFTDAKGEPVAHGRSAWVGIDMQRRRAIDLTELGPEQFPLGEQKCPLPKIPKMPLIKEPDSVGAYTFQYSDIDFNRHVNTVQYVRLILNQWPMSHYDKYEVESFNIAFQHECYFGEQVSLERSGDSKARIDIINPQGVRAIAAELQFTPSR